MVAGYTELMSSELYDSSLLPFVSDSLCILFYASYFYL